jgi:hypothetical protein
MKTFSRLDHTYFQGCDQGPFAVKFERTPPCIIPLHRDLAYNRVHETQALGQVRDEVLDLDRWLGLDRRLCSQRVPAGRAGGGLGTTRLDRRPVSETARHGD